MCVQRRIGTGIGVAMRTGMGMEAGLGMRDARTHARIAHGHTGPYHRPGRGVRGRAFHRNQKAAVKPKGQSTETNADFGVVAEDVARHLPASHGACDITSETGLRRWL